MKDRGTVSGRELGRWSRNVEQLGHAFRSMIRRQTEKKKMRLSGHRILRYAGAKQIAWSYGWHCLGLKAATIR